MEKNLNKAINAPKGSATSSGKLMTSQASEAADMKATNTTAEYESQPAAHGAVGGKNTFGAG